MDTEFIPWVPHADTPFLSAGGRGRTQSQIIQMHSLRSVHGSLRKIAHDLERSNSALVEFQELDSGCVGVGAQSSIGVVDKPSIQRSSLTPETAENNTVASWDRFSSVRPRGLSEAPGAGGLSLSAKEAPSQSPAPHANTNLSVNQHSQMLQPVRSVGLDPDSSDMMTCATSAFVSRQFESLSRKDIMLEEFDLRHTMLLLFTQATNALHVRERMAEKRRMREHIALLEEKEMSHQYAISEALRDAEEEARGRLQDFQIESSRSLQHEVSKLLSVLEDSAAKGDVKWLVMHEERRRLEIQTDYDRFLSRVMGEHVSELQKLILSFHLYLARSQNIAGHRSAGDAVDSVNATLKARDMSLHQVRSIQTSVAPSTAYDPHSEDSIAARRALAPAKQAKAKGSQIDKSYVDNLINSSKRATTNKDSADRGERAQNNNNSTIIGEGHSAPPKIKPQPSQQRDSTKADLKVGRTDLASASPANAVDKEAADKELATARTERLRQTKAAAVATAQAATRGAASQQGGAHSSSADTRKALHTKANDSQPKASASPIALTPASPATTSKREKKPSQQILEDADKDQGGSSLLAGVPVFDSEDEVEARRRAAVARDQLNALSQFEPVWGWMLKSTGVLMSWQRRFFVLTKSGKIKYTSQDPTREDSVRWIHLLNAEDITRVETDTFADTTVRPPTDQYHANCFYVDAVRSHRHPSDGSGPKTERFKFCCGNKAELNKWMWALRNATDVVYSLEEGGYVERSPLREHFRRMYALLSPLLSSSIQAAKQGQRAEGSELELPTYRKRAQMEDDIAALEAQQREAYLKERQREEEEQKKYLISPRTARSPSPPKATLHLV